MGLWNKMSIKVKVVLGAIAGILSFLLFFFVRNQIRARDKMKYELSRVESELKVAHLEEDSADKIKKIEQLKSEEALIREKIEFLEEKEAEEGREVSIEELDAFFSNRGL